MDLRKVTDMTDFFIVCSADSDIQARAIADAVEAGTEKLGIPAWHQEGRSEAQWVLLDYIDIVVHIFHKEARKYYSLEKIWGDAKVEEIEDREDKKPIKKPKRKAASRKTA
jgi:ribosome-associated protein